MHPEVIDDPLAPTSTHDVNATKEDADPYRDDAALTEHQVATIVAALKEHRTLLDAETTASHSTVEKKLRRERTIGALLSTLRGHGLLHKGGRPSNTKTDDKVSWVSLEDLNIRAEQSSRWQLEAKVPEDEFVKWLDKMKACDGEISSAALRRLAMGLGLRKKGEEGEEGTEFSEVDASVDEGPCPECGRMCDCVGEAS